MKIKMIPRRALLLLSGLGLCAATALAADAAGLSFSHLDWELACDNTRTCRAAGYQSDADDDLPVSVLLTRQAGPGQVVKGQLAIDAGKSEALLESLPATLSLAMRVNGRDLGSVAVRKDRLRGELSATQVGALLSALRRDSDIEWSTGELRWKLSDRGAAAVLLKMDDFQRRVGTQGALMRKGPVGEEGVLAPLPVPVVQLASVAKSGPGEARLGTRPPVALINALRDSLDHDRQADCHALFETRDAEIRLAVERLTASTWLVSTPCWRAAYNQGLGMWLVSDQPPYAAELVTDSASSYAAGKIFSAQRGRGIGDCWSFEDWAWDGRRFVQTRAATTGQCKGFEGGAWELPTLVTDLRR